MASNAKDETSRWRFPWRVRPLNPYYFRDKLHEALHSLGMLNGIWSMLKDPVPIAEMLARREAVLSWNLEMNDEYSLRDLLIYEMHEAPWFTNDSPFHDIARIASALNKFSTGSILDLSPAGTQRLQGRLQGHEGLAEWRAKEDWIPGEGKRNDQGHARLVYPSPGAIPGERWSFGLNLFARIRMSMPWSG